MRKEFSFQWFNFWFIFGIQTTNKNEEFLRYLWTSYAYLLLLNLFAEFFVASLLAIGMSAQETHLSRQLPEKYAKSNWYIVFSFLFHLFLFNFLFHGMKFCFRFFLKFRSSFYLVQRIWRTPFHQFWHNAINYHKKSVINVSMFNV